MKLPVAIKTIHDRTGRQTFCELTDVRKYDLKETSTKIKCFEYETLIACRLER